MANQAEQIQQAVCATIRDEVESLRGFVDRRVAELSTEVHATVQLMTFSEANLSGQLDDIRRQVAAMAAVPVAATRGAGREWDATVQAAEAAAERIVQAAGAIGNWVREAGNNPAALAMVNQKVGAAFGAGSFQGDIGQRIKRAIRDLQQVEAMLARVAPGEPGQPPGDAARDQLPAYKPGRVQGGASRAQPGTASARAGFSSRLALRAVENEHPAEPAANLVPSR